METVKICAFCKMTGKVDHHVAHSVAWGWDGSTQDTSAEWGTIMKHCAIKWVSDRLSGFWWASVSLQSSGALQLISHRGGRGRRGEIAQTLHHHARRKAITRPFPCAIIPTSTPNLQLWNQGLQKTREALDGSKGGWWVQSNKVVLKKSGKKKWEKKFWFCKWFISLI